MKNMEVLIGDQNKKLDHQNNLMEIHSRSVENKINSEIKKVVQFINGSAFEEIANGASAKKSTTSLGQVQVTKLIESKIDKAEIEEKLKAKSSKDDTEMLFR